MTVMMPCPDPGPHPEHEWYERNIFRRECPGANPPHEWIFEEDTNGRMYRFCTRCKRYEYEASHAPSEAPCQGRPGETPVTLTVQPFEARKLPELGPETDELRAAFSDLLTAVNGFPYHGEAADAVAYALRWMRAHPERANVLLNRSTAEEDL